MSDTNYPLGGEDDLPRTFRRARRERDAAQAQMAPPPMHEPLTGAPPAQSFGAGYSDAPVPATVRSIKVPFFKLVFFFIKAVFAAIPAMIMLGGLLWLAGELLTTYYPELLKLKIIIQVPQ